MTAFLLLLLAARPQRSCIVATQQGFLRLPAFTLVLLWTFLITLQQTNTKQCEVWLATTWLAVDFWAFTLAFG
jgi:hypothetical protein